MEFSVVMEDARILEKILQREGDTREAFVSKRIAAEFKAVMKEIDGMLVEEGENSP